MDPHSYELVKGDGELFDRADVIFFNGLGLEHGASLQRRLKEVRVISLGDQLFMECPQDFIISDGAVDPHFWEDVSLFSRCVDIIVYQLGEQAPSLERVFTERGERLKKKLAIADAEFLVRFSELPESARRLVTSHDAFAYFCRRYLAQENREAWRECAIAPEGLAPDGQMSLGDIQKVCDFLEKSSAPVLFPESNLSSAALNKISWICHQRGFHVQVCETPIYGDTMGEVSSDYLDMMEHNAKTICQALSDARIECND
ncbi:MAG: zinc ABC transporter substrate-binding protein, partial [Chlamydiota bacterium]|nr:zinc ABC transporter substrate-binding protein [Chlamydiota bacterium]